jgi:hypothetical protein
MYTSDKASGAAAMRASIGNGVRCTRRANGKLVTAGRLVTARRSVELSGQHSELLEQPGEIVAVQFPGKLAASDAHDQRPVPAHVSACGDTQAGGLVAGISNGDSGPALLSRIRECHALDRLLESVRVGQSRVLILRGESGVGKSALLEYVVGRASGCRAARAAGPPSEVALADAGLHQLCAPVLDLRQRLPAPQRGAGRSG